jgi:hypothetical protein
VTRRSAAVVLLAGYLVAVALAVTAAARAGDGYPGDARQVVNAIAAEFGAGPLGACFWKIAARETGGTFNPRAANWHDRHADGSRGSFGALQIGALWRRHGETVAHFARRMFDPAANARLARRLYERFGLAPWGGSC